MMVESGIDLSSPMGDSLHDIPEEEALAADDLTESQVWERRVMEQLEDEEECTATLGQLEGEDEPPLRIDKYIISKSARPDLLRGIDSEPESLSIATHDSLSVTAHDQAAERQSGDSGVRADHSSSSSSVSAPAVSTEVDTDTESDLPLDTPPSCAAGTFCVLEADVLSRLVPCAGEQLAELPQPADIAAAALVDDEDDDNDSGVAHTMPMATSASRISNKNYIPMPAPAPSRLPAPRNNRPSRLPGLKTTRLSKTTTLRSFATVMQK